MELIENLLQLLVTFVGALLSGISYRKSHRQAYFLLLCFYGCFALGKQSGIIACCFHLGVDNFNFARAVFIAHIRCIKIILACDQNDLTVVFNLQFLGACSSII